LPVKVNPDTVPSVCLASWEIANQVLPDIVSVWRDGDDPPQVTMPVGFAEIVEELIEGDPPLTEMPECVLFCTVTLEIVGEEF
jgi:hypothetical protein